jgi:hypothetical protein
LVSKQEAELAAATRCELSGGDFVEAFQRVWVFANQENESGGSSTMTEGNRQGSFS